jgi:hypothetical protein
MPLSWTDAYNLCLTRTADGILIEIFSIEQFNALKDANIDDTSLFWLGANNFASCKFNRMILRKSSTPMVYKDYYNKE